MTDTHRDEVNRCPWCGLLSRPADAAEKLPGRITRVCDPCRLVFTPGGLREFEGIERQIEEGPPRTDAELTALWALHDLERRQDGRLYRINGEWRLCPGCLGIGHVGADAIWPDMDIGGVCGRCKGKGGIGVPPGQRVAVMPPEKDYRGRWNIPPLPDGTRPAEPVKGDANIPGLGGARIEE